MMKVGVFTDAHYAEGLTMQATRTCGKSYDKVTRILQFFRDVDVVIQLGDLINVTGDAVQDEKNISRMQALLKELKVPCYSVLGNHDVETAPKKRFLPEHPEGYYTFEVGKFRFIVLDGNYISTGESYEVTEWRWTDTWIPEGQLAWLERTLQETAGPAIVLCHQNLDDRGDDPHLIGNASQVRALLEKSGKVAAVLQGHCHRGCFSRVNGIPYYTFRALCEKENVPCAIVSLMDDGSVQVEEMELNRP